MSRYKLLKRICSKDEISYSIWKNANDEIVLVIDKQDKQSKEMLEDLILSYATQKLLEIQVVLNENAHVAFGVIESWLFMRNRESLVDEDLAQEKGKQKRFYTKVAGDIWYNK